MRPDLKWLVLKGQVGALGVTTFTPKNLPNPFQPLGIAYKSTGRAIGQLLVGDEPLSNAKGDLAAQFGQDGHLVIIPEDGQRIYPAKREWKLAVTDLSNATNDISLAMIGYQYTGLPRPRKTGPSLRWLNLYDTVLATKTKHITDRLDFPFMPFFLGYASTGRAEVSLEIDGLPLMNQAADLAAMFGTLGKLVPIPPEARRKYLGKITFDAVVTDLSGGDNVVTVTLFGVQFEGED